MTVQKWRKNSFPSPTHIVQLSINDNACKEMASVNRRSGLCGTFATCARFGFQRRARLPPREIGSVIVIFFSLSFRYPSIYTHHFRVSRNFEYLHCTLIITRRRRPPVDVFSMAVQGGLYYGHLRSGKKSVFGKDVK